MSCVGCRDSFGVSAESKSVAEDDLFDECCEAVILCGGVLQDFFDDGAIVVFEAASDGVDQKFFADAADKLFAAIQDGEAEFGWAGEFGAIGQFAGGIDGEAAILSSPASDGVVVFESEAEGIHFGMAIGTGGVGAVNFHALSEGGCGSIGG